MGKSYDVSVVLSTYNRCKLLPTVLDSLLAQDTRGVSAEVIVVDNNSTDRTREVVQSYIEAGAADLRYVFEAKQGVSYGRNAGIASARGPLIAFTDDDIRVGPGWVSQLKQTFDAHPEVAFIGGKVLPAWEVSPPVWLTPAHWAPLALVDYGPAPFYVDRQRQVCLLTANAAFRREALESVGLFSPLLQRVKDGIGSMEDQELEFRLIQAGRRGLYIPDLVVYSPVQVERLTKEYHRRWHRGHGHFHALLRDPEMERSRARLFDVPIHFFRQALQDAVALALGSSLGKHDEAFLRETRLCFFAGFFRTRYREFSANRQRSRWYEVVRSLYTSILSTGQQNHQSIRPLSGNTR
jgi:glycosyltransferase involved in cell wall biosynthesis